MRRILHIVSREEDSLAAEIATLQRQLPACLVDVVDLTRPEPDYQVLLEKIFRADSIEVW